MFRFGFTNEQIIEKIRSRLKKFNEDSLSEFLVLMLSNLFEVKEP